MSEAVVILAVDDEPEFEGLLSQKFRQRIRSGDLKFLFARDGEEALAVLVREPDIRLLLLDINMPIMDGLTVLSHLRRLRSPVHAVIVSAYGEMSTIRTAMNLGAFDFVTKPIDLNDLEVTIDKTLETVAFERQQDERRIASDRARANLSRYFSPNLVDLLTEREEPLGPVRREDVAVLFIDIVGFTQMAETMQPEAVVTLLREFHARMTEHIFACGGTVEKYSGDEIFVVFGAPTPSEQDPINALHCASRMLRALEHWNEERRASGEEPLCVGIGLNYGPAVMGNVGTEQTLSFTVLGDTVNVASRLQALTRTLNTPLLVADALLKRAEGWDAAGSESLSLPLQDVGYVDLRGRKGATRVWKAVAESVALR